MTMPLFSCKDCGMRIERSMAAYWKHKGQLVCSSCQDRRETEVQTCDNDNNMATSTTKR